MLRFSLVCVFALLVLLPLPLRAASELYLPVALADKVETVESTTLDMGPPTNLFDRNVTTIVRTPGLNPAFFRVLFKEPVELAYVRVLFQAGEYDWSLAAADSFEDLKAQSGSYRAIFKDQTSQHERAEARLETPVKARAYQLDVRRLTGDGYVHIADWQFCTAAKPDKLIVQRVIDRRQAHHDGGRKEVNGPITVPTQTVVWFKVRAAAGDTTLDLDAQPEHQVTWRASDAGLQPWRDEPGMFLVTQPGEHTLTVGWQDFDQRITIKAQPRDIKNRRDDVQILFIERLPRIDYDGPNGGWPAERSDVTWRGHLYNWGNAPVAVRYAWKLDGAEVGSGEVTLPVGPPGTDTTFVELPWKWEQARHDLTLSIEPATPLDEVITANNTLTIQTNAVTVGFYVEQSLWEFHHEHQYRLPTHDGNSFADWTQRLVRKWNEMFAAAVYPAYPQGVVERVRVDRIVVVPDFALPLAGGIPSNNPNLDDKTIDMQWGIEETTIHPPYELPKEHWWSPERTLEAFAAGRVQDQKEDPPFWCGLGFIHELSHARYLVDSYGFNVHSGQGEDVSKRNLPMLVDGQPLFGRYMKWSDDVQHWQKHVGQMGGDYWKWSLFETMCWNRVAGRRARGGNCNAPETIGEFLQDIPKELTLQFVDQTGQPLADAEIRVYRARGNGKDWYAKVYPTEPDVVGKPDGEGRYVTNSTLWAEDGKIRHSFGFSNAVAFIQLTYRGQHYFLFEEVTDANIAYNLGQRDACTLKRWIKLRAGDPSPEEWDPKATWDQPPSASAAAPASEG